VHFNVTAHPTAEWTAQQYSKPFHSTQRLDISCEIGTESTDMSFAQVAVMNINEVLSAPRSPWQCAYVERVIGSIRRESLDHVIVLNEDSLRGSLRSYFSYYHRSRLHLSLERDSPESRPVQSVGRVVAFPEVGGLHHRYERVA
jgi:transposase InsO family protein